MDPNTWETIEAIFHAALERPAPERAAFVAEACGGDGALAAEVSAMLAAHDSGAGLRIESALLDEPERERADAGTRIGAWRLVRLLGRGGMGDVWLAERADGAYEQRAAIKRVRSGWRPAELIARFRRERQVLARLVHPNIARLLDGGTAESGEPFLAMEYVEGEPITAWCDARRLPVRERLRLFARVCEAVRFAHANLVVHRDLKPANILVTADGRPVLLDFGIAKLLDPDEGPALRTRSDDRLLTPEHAAPEQLRGEAVTTATDVWGLGVLLYELLVGARPFQATGRSSAEIERLVLDAEPRRPSEAVRPGRAAAPGDAGGPAALRSATAAGLAHALRGDLDAIVLTALRKEPGRRYGSAEQLGADVERFLRGLPVLARPDSTRYRLAKFVRRHRAGVLAGTLLGASLLAFGVVASEQARRIAIERDRAREEEARSSRVLSVLVDLFQVSDPRTHPGGDTLRVADLLRLAEGRIDQIGDQPLIQSRLWETVASIHGSRSELAEQRVALDKALAAARLAGEEDLALRIRGAQAALVGRLRGAAPAESLMRGVLADSERRYGPADARVAAAAEMLASFAAGDSERLALIQRSLAIRRAAAPQGSVELASSLNQLGGWYLGHGRPVEARRWYDESLALAERFLPPDHPDRLLVRSNVADCEAALGRFEESNRMHRDLLAVRRRILGPRTTAVASSLLNIGQNLMHLGRPGEAADSIAVSYDILASIFGREGHAVIGAERNLAIALLRAGRSAEARPHLRHALEVMGTVPGAPSAEEAFLRLRVAAIAGARAGHADPAALRPHLARIVAKRPGASAMIAEGLLELGTAALEAPDRALPGEAAAAFRRAVALADSFVPPGHPLNACARLGDETARRAEGRAWDRARADSALAACETWGLAPPALLRRARAALAAR